MCKSRRVRTCLPAALLLLGPALAQQQPGGVSGDSTTADSDGNSSTQRRPTNPFPREARPLYLYGSVLVDGIGPPGELAAIESDCNGRRRTEGYTDSKGRFSIDLGERNGSGAQDASVGGDLGIARSSPSGPSSGNSSAGGRRLEGCELRALLPGYESDTITLAGRISDLSDLGVIFLHRLGPAKGQLVSMTSLAAPKDAQKAFRKGRLALAQGKREDAMKNLEMATRLYPNYALAWFELGKLQLVGSDMPAARASFETATRADARFLPPYVALAAIEGAAREWPQVRETTARAIALDPYGFPQMYFYNALAKYCEHDLAGAETSAREAERLDKDRNIAGAWELLGYILATRRDFAGAAEQFRTYLALLPHASNATVVRARLERMERLSARASDREPAK